MFARCRSIGATIVAVAALSSCSNWFSHDEPPDAPGKSVAGLYGGRLCPAGDLCQGAWSPDSKTLYFVASALTGTGGVIVAVDPAAGTYKEVATVDRGSTGLVVSPDGASFYFAAPNSTNGVYAIIRTAVATGSATTITSARTGSFLVSGDGATLAYLAPGGSSAVDTVVALDLASGARRATTVILNLRLGALSSDGSRLLLFGGYADSLTMQTWRVTTGARDTLVTGWQTVQLRDARWEGSNVRLLFSPYSRLSATKSVIDSTIGPGTRVLFTPSDYANAVAWLPGQNAFATVFTSTVCTSQDCNLTLSRFAFVTTSSTKMLGSSYQGSAFFSISPDGHWISHGSTYGELYFLGR